MRHFPSKNEILDWIRDNPQAAGKREIARAFGLKGADRVELKRVLRELEDEGHLSRRKRRMRPSGHLPPVTVLTALAPDRDGDIFARPQDWDEGGPPPPILYMPRKGDPALGAGDRFLAKLHPVHTEEALTYEARLIKRLAAGPRSLLGIFREAAQGGRVVPVDKKASQEWEIASDKTAGAKDGELVEAESLPRTQLGPRLGLRRGVVVARLGDPGAPRQVSLIAIHEHGIPYTFPEEVLEEAGQAALPAEGHGEDLRKVPLVTIDPVDARDHDDAVAAMPDDDPKNKGGWVVWVAIADVACCVRPGSELDREARRRGNSTYFPDRVAPMLPEALSADLCSLHEGVERPCLAVRMVLNAEGEKISHRFTRGTMRSRASLNYAQVQTAADGSPDEIAAPLVEPVIEPLFAAYRATARARDRRQPLDLDLPERKVEIGEDGQVTAVAIRERLEAHRLIEEFMILANVAAAETLEERRRPLLYRVHEEPNPEKLDALREIVDSVGLTLAKGQVLKTRHLNDLLVKARETEMAEMVNIAVLRAQTQAYYAAQNFGHFGLHLRRYAHFTSPIRRYADLVVHRALIATLKLGEGGQTPEEAERLDETAEHISMTERRSMEAERDTVDRYLAAFLKDRIGGEFAGRVSGVARFGIFVKLDETGADGLVPVSTLGREYFRYDAETQTLSGDETGLVLGLGQKVSVRLVEAAPVTGGLILELLSVEGQVRRPPRGGRGARGGRKLTRARIAKAKAARKERRKR
ncbi:MAG: ribonuclease R [Paracoccaceae bacterium]|nr:ribonuclease R [Paracoccaceae bacterium]